MKIIFYKFHVDFIILFIILIITYNSIVPIIYFYIINLIYDILLLINYLNIYIYFNTSYFNKNYNILSFIFYNILIFIR